MRKAFWLLVLAVPVAALAEWASTTTVKCEWCLTTSSASFTGNCIDRSTGLAVSAVAGSKNVTIENRSSATAYVEWDGTAVTTTGTTGDKWAAGDKWSLDVQGQPFLAQATGASTANMTTGACLLVRQWK